MPVQPANGLTSLSLFSGGGGLDLGFERAGFIQGGSYELLTVCGETLKANRPSWDVHSGESGDVIGKDWSPYKGKIDVMHGGPPCQPFSIAGHQRGPEDERNMWPEFVRAVLQIEPECFVAENVLGLLDPKFQTFVSEFIERPLAHRYSVIRFVLSAESFGVPQIRKRVFFVGFRDKAKARHFSIPNPTHALPGEFPLGLRTLLGAREALGLKNIGFDCSAPTLRSGFTGPRNTTGVVNSQASSLVWARLEIWPNGVQADRISARNFPTENGHFRLSVPDCAILQGFPEDWKFQGAVYKALGQIGNSVCPPVAFHLALAVACALMAGNGSPRRPKRDRNPQLAGT